MTYVLTLYIWLASVDFFGNRKLSIKFCLKARQVGAEDVKEKDEEEEVEE